MSAHILLVDDNDHGLKARKTILEELGYRVTATHCPSLALNHFRAETFDLVITDFRMPAMSGAELIAHLRTHTPAVPVVLISGFTDTLGLTETGTGADVIIQKSNHEVSMMVRSVDRLLNRTRAPRKPAAREGRPATRSFSAAAQ